MATNTYTALATQTISGSSTSTITFSSIPSGYTDLVLVSSAQMSGTGTSGTFRFNGDTASNYSFTYLSGNGTTASSGRQSSQTAGIWDSWPDRLSNTMFEADILHIQNYSNTTTYKTAIGRSNSASTTEAFVNLWRSTAAINSITLFLTTGNFVAGSTFTLYGIAAQPVAAAKATGGTIYFGADGYVYHKFTGNGTFTPTTTLTADILAIAGGGGGGANQGGGGGAGGLLAFTSQSLSVTGYTVTIGSGGTGQPASTGVGPGGNGTYSQFGALTQAAGGGGGGGRNGTTPQLDGQAGGSGGGGATDNGNAGAASPSGQGFAGGAGAASNWAGGGGGATSVGTAGGAASPAGTGGTGSNAYSTWALITSSGASGYYAGGGGGAAYDQGVTRNGAPGGAGGGGQGGGSNGATGVDGTANTGGGGGGQEWNRSTRGGNGGSGIVIVRYLA